MKTRSLTPAARAVICERATEPPFSHAYTDLEAPGSWLCRQCGLALFRAVGKFHSGCGWPSFDRVIGENVREVPDADGRRMEIICARCRGHLGHVFRGEGFTAENLRHCVNGVSLDFVSDEDVLDTEEAIFAAGCFWGVEYYLKMLPGVLKTEVGYTGGHTDKPSYSDVCNGRSGHYEAIRVLYDPRKVNYETLTKYFFEIHNPEQIDGQGPDHGEQYRSAIFYHDDAQANIARELIALLTQKGLHIATRILPAAPFWTAEDYHQDYYTKTGKSPYCHMRVKRF